MDFISYADSLRAKLHLGGARLPLLIGVTAIALAAIVALGFGAASLISSDEGFVVERAEADANKDTLEPGAGQGNAQTIFVHVGGAVANPGLYELDQGDRVQQAVDAAGGFADGAAVDALNLARTLGDGEQVLVPSLESSQQSSGAEGANGEGASSPAVGVASQTSGKVNINTASAAELQQLNGVGPSLSERIVADRQANGPFSSTEDLKRVSGIGDKKFASLADAICVG